MKGAYKVRGKYWRAEVQRNGVRRVINCPSEEVALAKARELREMPLDEFCRLLPNGKTDPARL